MERADHILKHRTYKACLHTIEELEEKRIFCRHDLSHFMDVARIAYILNLEAGTSISKEEIYAAALLHDIGRHEQYLRGIPHHEASAKIAESILEDCGFSPEERSRILAAILDHRTNGKRENVLSEIIYRADKISRPCYGCKAEAECNWSLEKKNRNLQY